MDKRQLGKADLNVSILCLGTMTWGTQNTAEQGYEQMDYAVEKGINFFDTAELYAIPPSAETCGRTEEIIGEWFTKTGKRQDIILATKVAGPVPEMPWIRGTDNKFDTENIKAAIDHSLKNLQTDYIDLYQLHWPERPVNSFGRLNFPKQEVDEQEVENLLKVLRILDECVKSGKIRHIGLSNETAWGVMTFLRLAREYDLPEMVSVQNPYSLLNRTHEIALSEISLHEKCGLLPYSPLGGGCLSGKYLNGQMPAGSRRSIDGRKSRYNNKRGEQAVQSYVDLAQKHGLDVAQMALAFVNQQSFVTSNIIGATKMEQLKSNIASADLKLSDEIIIEINEIHLDNPNPCP